MSGHKPNILVVALKQGDQVISQADAQRYGGKTFDLYINDLQTGKTRRLTDVSEHGGEAHQSSPARDGKSFVYSLRASANGPNAGKSGLYIGTFSPAN